MTSFTHRCILFLGGDHIPATAIGIGEWAWFVQSSLFLAFPVVLALVAAKFWPRSSGGRAHDIHRMGMRLPPPRQWPCILTKKH